MPTCGPIARPREVAIDLEHSLEDHAVTLAVKGPDLHHALGPYSGQATAEQPRPYRQEDHIGS